MVPIYAPKSIHSYKGLHAEFLPKLQRCRANSTIMKPSPRDSSSYYILKLSLLLVKTLTNSSRLALNSSKEDHDYWKCASIQRAIPLKWCIMLTEIAKSIQEVTLES